MDGAEAFSLAPLAVRALLILVVGRASGEAIAKTGLSGDRRS